MKRDETTRPDRSAEDEELLRYLADLESGQTGARTGGLVRRPAGEDAPLSFGQQRLWVLDQIEGNNPALHLSLALRLSGPLDERALGEALDAVVVRHEVLRTAFVMKDLGPVQRVLPSLSLELPVTDLSHVPSDAQTKELKDAMRELMRMPFDLAAPPLIRARLLRLGAEEHSLLLVLHHAVADRWSLMLLSGEIVQLYTAYSAGRSSPLQDLPAQYGDYAAWERERLQGPRLDQLLGYWRRQLAALEPLELPLDRVRPAVQTFVGASEATVLPRAALQSLDRVARSCGCTRFMALLAVFVAVLQRYSSQSDVVVGTPISNRNVPELERLIGFFLSTLVLRVDCSGDPSFVELLERVRRTTLDAYAHQELPFERIVQDLNPRRDLSRSPLFQVLFVQLDQTLSTQSKEGAAAAFIKAGEISFGAEKFGRDVNDALRHDLVESTQYDLEAYVGEIQEGLFVRFIYNVDLFEAETMRQMVGHFRQVLERSTQSVDRRLSDLTVLGDDERRLLLRDWNATAHKVPTACLPALIVAQAARTPQAVAIQAADGALSYAQLQARAAALAARLEALGVGVGDRVAVCVERTLDLPVSLLGVMASGAAYVPLDPGFPDERLRYMVDDARASVVVTQARLEREWPGRTVLDLDAEGETLWSTARPGPAREPSPRDLAYVIYTSGSTGKPKGVCIEHAALVNFLWSMRDRPGLNAQDVLVSVTTLSFDIFGLELFLPLLVGARVVLASRDDAIDGAALVRLLEASGASVMQATPATWRMLVESGWRGRAQLTALCGGEALPPALAAQLAGRVGSLWNLYGPTETTIWSTVEAVDASSLGATVSIGRPIGNTRVYVLDERLQPVPVGVSGELWIGGAGVARGYWERPELTAERFVTDPFVDDPDARMYRTGDVARWRRDGRLEHLGRLDHQVKLRGYRIELGEIEAVLEECEGVSQAVVVCREMAGEARLVAYVVGEVREARGLDAYVRERLPGYMVPGAWMFLDQLPLTPNGKVDRRALPEPEAVGIGAAAYVAPRSQLERTVAEIWSQVLGLERVGVHDGFFELGGHSLQLTAVRARLESALGRRIAMADLFRFPTVEAFAASLGDAQPTVSVVEAARVRMQARAGGHETEHAVAIVGMAFRFPGASNPEAFWNVLAEGIEPMHVFTPEELREAGVSDELIANPKYVNRRGIIDGIELFDAGFFGYSPREAELLDPQQRLFLECAWEALESAGYDPRGMEVPVGVYAGSAMNMYLLQLFSRPDLIAMAGGAQALTGSDIDYLPMRVSYKLNLRGPSVNLQTTCSSSLVAVHTACRDLRAGDCDMALAGAANLRLPVVGGHLYQESGILSPDGHCRAFDAAGAGTLFGDGVGIVALKRLRDALADGDTIRAVILGTATNNDGSDKVGFTAPNVNAQAAVIATALADANVAPATIGYLEAHGTATALGDPIEVAALNQVFAGCERGSSALGTVKSNFGHLDRVAGLAGLIKTTLALEHRQIPPSLHYREPNPEIDFDAGPFFVNTALRDWRPRPGSPRRAGVSSFGMGGTNAHAVLEEAPPPVIEGEVREWQLLPLSARSPAALAQACERLGHHLAAVGDGLALADVAHTLQRGRHDFEHRIAFVVRDLEQARQALSTGSAERRRLSPAAQGSPQVVFMFPGQGAQHTDMAKGLYGRERVFREALDGCCEILQPKLGYDLREALFPAGVSVEQASARLARTSVTQPALFAVEYALARQWMAWGIQPAAMIGHSIGEYVAACLSGVLGLEEALGLVATRAALMEQAPRGVMLAILAPESRVVPQLGDDLWLAAVNGPQACAVSGTEASIAALEARLAAQNITCRRLVTSHGFHSGLMEPVLEPLAEAAAKIKPGAAKVRYVSNVTGDWIQAEQLADTRYWARHTRDPVRFDDGLTTILETLGHCALLEVGPGRGLAQLVRPRLAGRAGCAAVSSLGPASGERDDGETLTRALSELWVAGVAPNWKAYTQGYRQRRIPLPTYPFERKRYWVEPARTGVPTPRASAMEKAGDPAQWFYVPSWVRSPLPRTVRQPMAGRWLIVHGSHPVGTALAERLRGEGEVTEVSLAGNENAAPARYAELIAEFEARQWWPATVVHMGGLDQAPAEDRGARGLDAGFYSLLDLSRALARSAPPGQAIRYLIVTDGAQEVAPGDVVSAENAALIGLARVIPQEFPDHRCRHVDLQAGACDVEGQAQMLWRELAHDGTEVSLAYRGGQRWAQRFEHLEIGPVPDEALPLRERGLYLISGGLGKLGLRIARFLIDSVQAKVVLTARTDLGPREAWDAVLSSEPESARAARIRAVRALESAGGEVVVAGIGAADRQGMRALIEQAEARFGPLRGVVHAAGSVTGAALANLERAACEDQFAAKLDGVEALDVALGERALDFAILMSSLSAVLGGLGFGAYAAANACLDAYAATCAGTKRRWLSVDWDAWRDDEDQPTGGTALARLAMTPKEGIEVLRRTLSVTEVPRLVVSTGDLHARLAQWVVMGPLAPREESAEADQGAAPAYERPELQQAYVAPRTEIETQLARIWSQVLGIDRVGVHDDFLELGGHSLLALQLVSRLRAELALELTLEAIFQAPTVARLAERVEAMQASMPASQERVAALKDRLERLSPDERKALLAEARTRRGSSKP